MKRSLLLIVSLVIGTLSFAQTVTRGDHETTEAFIKRIIPESTELVHPIIETNVWDSAAKAILVFYGYDDPKDINAGFNTITGRLYVPLGKGSYRTIPFGPIEENGGYPEVISVFFANADKDKAKELVVLVKHDQRHYDYSGAFYGAYIYDNPGTDSTLTYLEDLSEKFNGCECGWREGKEETAKYKTASEVKAGLKKMGY
jgi:hypothetical protein